MLQADGITYEIETQDGPLKLLDNVSFNVPKGHFMAVVGPSGCGKTTLLKAIAGMVAETDGRFFWNGHDLAEEDFEPFSQRLEQAGVTVWKQNKSEGASFYFLDPDGHKLELHVGSLAARLAACREKPYAGMVFTSDEA